MVGRPARSRRSATAKEPRGKGELEAEILTCLAGAGRRMTAAEVLEAIGGGLAYTTVMTTLSRLYQKGALERSSAGRAFEYSLVGGTQRARTNMTAHQMLKLLDEQSDRSGVLTKFVAELNPADERLLSRLLERAAQGAPEPPTRRRRGGGG